MSAEDSVSQLERELEIVERSMSAVGALSAQQAEGVAERVDRLASQLLEITTPEPWDAVHARLGTTPASDEDFSALATNWVRLTAKGAGCGPPSSPARQGR